MSSPSLTLSWCIDSIKSPSRSELLKIVEDSPSWAGDRSKTSPIILVQFCVFRGNPESQRGKVLEIRIVEAWSRTWVAPWFRITKFSCIRQGILLCSVILESEPSIDSRCGMPLLMHRQFINSCLSCSISSFFATNSSQFFNFLAISCMIFLEEPISQFQFSTQANFYLSELDLPIDLLDVPEIVEIQVLAWSLEKRCKNSLLPTSCLNFSLSFSQSWLSYSLSLQTAESTFRSRIFWRFSLNEYTTFWSRSLSSLLTVNWTLRFPISRLNRSISFIQFLLSYSLSSNSWVNFPFKDLLEIISVVQRMHYVCVSISSPLDIELKIVVTTDALSNTASNFLVKVNPPTWSPHPVSWCLSKPNIGTLMAAVILLLLASEYGTCSGLAGITVRLSDHRNLGWSLECSIGNP